MEYSIAILIFVFVLYGMIFLVQKFLENVDPSNRSEQSHPVSRDIGSDYRNKIFYIKIKMGVGRLPYFLS